MSRRAPRYLVTMVWGSALIIAGLTSLIFRLNFLLAVGLVVIAWIVTGLLAEIEDRLPGGFLNPHGRGKKDQEK